MLPACASLTIVAAMSEESVMKQALSPEVPARVRRSQFRALSLGIGASLFAAACSFGQVDQEPQIDEVDPSAAEQTDEPANVGDEPETIDQGGATVAPPRQGADDVDDEEADRDRIDPNDPFTGEEGRIVKEILELNCGNCHVGQ